jgi:hypothetical protein
MPFVPERRRSRRILDVRAADLQEEMAEQRFSVPSASDEDGSYAANIAASEASNQIQRDPPRPGLRAAVLDERASRHAPSSASE